jgi:hypothetical protein
MATAPRIRTMCEHGRHVYLCKDCGTGYCEHDRQRLQCRDCTPDSFCEHGRRSTQCKDCGGGYREHGRLRHTCKECGGASVCEHNRQRRACSLCEPEKVFKIYAGNRSKSSKREFTLTLDEFKALIIQPCLYCGESEQPRGIDRWKNEISYVLDNCRPCCRPCNWMKGSMDGAVFVEHLQRAAFHTISIEQSDLYAALAVGD